jgi:hypothetical protein
LRQNKRARNQALLPHQHDSPTELKILDFADGLKGAKVKLHFDIRKQNSREI